MGYLYGGQFIKLQYKTVYKHSTSFLIIFTLKVDKGYFLDASRQVKVKPVAFGVGAPPKVEAPDKKSCLQENLKCFSIERSMNEDFLRWVGET